MIAFFIIMPFWLENSRQERKRKITIPQILTRNVVVKIKNDRSCFPVSRGNKVKKSEKSNKGRPAKSSSLSTEQTL